MESLMDKLVFKCEAVAKANQDTFRYAIKLNVNEHTGHYTYNVEVTEPADGHIFVSGHGLTLRSAVADAIVNIKEACADWHYINPKETH